MPEDEGVQSMRAVVMRRPGQPMQVEEITLDAPGEAEVLVRIEAAGVCHSDYHYLTGEIPAPLPIVLGHEGAGVVEAVGPRSSGRVSVGDRVALTWRPRCGRCAACVSGNPVLCVLGRVQATTGGLTDGTTRMHIGTEPVHHFLGVSCFAERVVVSESAVVIVPDGVPPQIAAIAGCAVVTGVGAAMNVVRDVAGRAVVVFGAGGVGLSTVMGLVLTGAGRIVVVDVDSEKLERARQLGATDVVDASSVDAVARIAELEPDGVPWAIDAVGRPQTMQQGFECLAGGGTLVAIGLSGATTGFTVPINQLVQRQKRIVGSLYGSSNPLLDLPRIFDLYREGRLPLDELIGERYGLDQVDEAYAALAAGAVGRALVIP